MAKDVTGNIEKLPPDSQTIDVGGGKSGNKSGKVLVREEVHTIFVGPLPPPEELAKYNEVDPGLANRIVLMAEGEQKHRHRMNGWEVFQGLFGQLSALVIALTLIVGGLVTVNNGHQIPGGILTGIGLAPLIGLFLWRSRISKKDSLPAKQENQSE